MGNNKMFQVSTLEALRLGYSKSVITAGELICHGNAGLGTFEDVNGEMILIDSHVYRADSEGKVTPVRSNEGIPFASVGFLTGVHTGELTDVDSKADVEKHLNMLVDSDFGLNSFYLVRIDGRFNHIDARSEGAHPSHHVELKDILDKTGTAFTFDAIEGSMICLYHPDYLEGINAPGWHFHFISDDRTCGGHVFDFSVASATYTWERLQSIEIRLPEDKAFDTYALKNVSAEAIKAIEG